MKVGVVYNSFTDSPNGSALVVFFPRCNLRCPYCYNKSLVELPYNEELVDGVDIEKVKDEILKCRKPKPNSNDFYYTREWLILSGGECTLSDVNTLNDLLLLSLIIGQKRGIYTNAVLEKSQRYIEHLLVTNTLNFLNVDYKVPVGKNEYFSIYDSKFSKFVKFLIDYAKNKPDFILRFSTVAVKQFLQVENYFEKISNELIDAGFDNYPNISWRISQFHCDDYSNLIDETFTKRKTYIKKEDINNIIDEIKKTNKGRIELYE